MLLESTQVIALFFVALAVIAVPGPSVLFVVSRGISLGRQAALATVVGNELGLLVQVAAVAAGLGAVVQSSIVVYEVIRFLGAGYLMFLGVQAIRHRRSLAVAPADRPAPVSTRKAVLEGAIVGVSNPKGLLLFAAILPQFVNPAAGYVPLQMLELGLICVAIALASDSVWAVFAGAASNWLGGAPRRMEAIGGAAGVVMIGLGLHLAVTGGRD
jgi:threonine/homoserine/homoserine lactone efflux protein